MNPTFIVLYFIRMFDLPKTTLLKRATSRYRGIKYGGGWLPLPYTIMASLAVRKAFNELVACGRVRYTPLTPVTMAEDRPDILTSDEIQWYANRSQKTAMQTEIYLHEQNAKLRQCDLPEGYEPEEAGWSPMCVRNPEGCDACLLYRNGIGCLEVPSPYHMSSDVWRQWQRAKNHRIRQQAFRKWQQAERSFAEKLKELL